MLHLLPCTYFFLPVPTPSPGPVPDGSTLLLCPALWVLLRGMCFLRPPQACPCVSGSVRMGAPPNTHTPLRHSLFPEQTSSFFIGFHRLSRQVGYEVRGGDGR